SPTRAFEMIVEPGGAGANDFTGWRDQIALALAQVPERGVHSALARPCHRSRPRPRFYTSFRGGGRGRERGGWRVLVFFRRALKPALGFHAELFSEKFRRDFIERVGGEM